MSQKMSHCEHVACLGPNFWEDIKRKKQTQDECDTCEAHGPNLWLCLQDQCLYMGCGESAEDHSSTHAEEKSHCLTLNMTTFRVWCYSCEAEVFLEQNNPPVVPNEANMAASSDTSSVNGDQLSSHSATVSRSNTPTHEDETETDEEDETQKPRGLVGLQNIGNTCYMNSAIQSLSNCLPLTRYFLDCPGYVQTDKKPMLSKHYMKLVSEIWHKKRPSYLVPSSVANGIKVVHPMFRGFTQQDSQEFLRCFMDQIHEELKQPVSAQCAEIAPSSSDDIQEDNAPEDSCDEDKDADDDVVNGQQATPAVSATLRPSPKHRPKQLYHKLPTTGDSEKTQALSDAEYETCESGQSSERGSREPINGGGDVPVNAGQRSPETLRSGPCREGEEPLDIMKLCQAAVGPGVTREDSQGSLHNPDLDSGIGSSRSSSTVACSSPSNSSLVSEDTAPSRGGEKWNGAGDSPVQSKSNKDFVNKQQQQDQSGSNSPQTSPTVSMSAESVPGSPTNSSGMDTELAEDAYTSQGQQSTTTIRSQQQKRAKNQGGQESGTSKKSRSRTTSERSRQSSKSAKKKVPEYQSVISDIFDGKILSSVQCLTCERVSATNENFQDLSLPIPSKDYLHMIHASHGTMPPPTSSIAQNNPKGSCGEVHLNQGWFSWIYGWFRRAKRCPVNFSWFWGPTISLRDCLATFFSADELKGDNMYSCEKCKKLRNGIKYSKVLKLPEILCIHLKRFRHEFMFSSKINSYVSFPLEGLDMGPYLHKNCSDQVTIYDLNAVICHHGTAGGGHYTSYGQNYINTQWYEFDDQYVTEVDMQQVENCEAYVLFYRKRNEHMIPVRQKAEQIMEVQERTFLSFYVSKQWINKFNTFAEPGPITNNDFLCHHGGVHPHKYSYVNELVQEIPQKLWEYLHERFGGGPAVNRLYLCDECQMELERLKNRQRTEMDTFVKLHEEFQSEDYCGKIYAISMSWFKEWESFVRAKTNDPPGPVDNSKICASRNSQPALRMNSDYGQLSQEMWTFLFDIYSGGPELLIRQNRPPSPASSIHKSGSEDSIGTSPANKGSPEVKV